MAEFFRTLGVSSSSCEADKTFKVSILYANTFGLRLRGLLGRPKLANNQGLLLHPCASVHTWFMCQSIDLVFLDSKNKVLGLEEGVKPWRFVIAPSKTAKVLELNHGGIAIFGLFLHNMLSFK